MNKETIINWQQNLRFSAKKEGRRLYPMAPAITDGNLRQISTHFQRDLFDMVQEIGHLQPLMGANLPLNGCEAEETHQALTIQWDELRQNPVSDAAFVLLHDMAQHGIYEVYAGEYPEGWISPYDIGELLYQAGTLPQDEEGVRLLGETLAALEYNTALLMRNRAVAEWDRGGKSRAIDVKVESVGIHLRRYNAIAKHMVEEPLSVNAVALFFPHGPPSM